MELGKLPTANCKETAMMMQGEALRRRRLLLIATATAVTMLALTHIAVCCDRGRLSDLMQTTEQLFRNRRHQNLMHSLVGHAKDFPASCPSIAAGCEIRSCSFYRTVCKTISPDARPGLILNRRCAVGSSHRNRKIRATPLRSTTSMSCNEIPYRDSWHTKSVKRSSGDCA